MTALMVPLVFPDPTFLRRQNSVVTLALYIYLYRTVSGFNAYRVNIPPFGLVYFWFFFWVLSLVRCRRLMDGVSLFPLLLFLVVWFCFFFLFSVKRLFAGFGPGLRSAADHAGPKVQVLTTSVPGWFSFLPSCYLPNCLFPR